MHEPYVPFELTAICRCSDCNKLVKMNWTLDTATGVIALTAPTDWHFNPRYQEYECGCCYWQRWEGEDVEPDY
jgi:hypothetical protein